MCIVRYADELVKVYGTVFAIFNERGDRKNVAPKRLTMRLGRGLNIEGMHNSCYNDHQVPSQGGKKLLTAKRDGGKEMAAGY